MKTNPLFCGSAMLLGSAFLMNRALSQPATAPTTKPMAPLSLAELEKLIGGRTTLTLNLKDATLEDAAAAINASSGLKLKVRPRPVFKLPPGMDAAQFEAPKGPLYNFEAKGGPFWEEFLAWQRAAIVAMKAIPPRPDIVLGDGRVIHQSPDTDLTLFRLQDEQQETNLQRGDPFPIGRSLVSWPYVMVGTRLSRTQRASLDEEGLQIIEAPRLFNPYTGRGMGAATAPKPLPNPLPDAPKAPPTEAERWFDGLTLSAQVYLDPKIKPLNLRCEVEEAIDDQGNDLRVPNERASMDDFFSRGFASSGGTSLSLPIASKPKMGKKLVRLRGSLRFSVITKKEHWETTDLDTPKDGIISRDGTDFAVRFEGLTLTPNGWEANFSARGEGQRLQQLLDQWRNEGGLRQIGVFGGSAFVVQFVDGDGQIYTSQGGGVSGNFSDGGGNSVPIRPGDSAIPANFTNPVLTEKTTRIAGRRVGGRGETLAVRPVKIIVDLPIDRREVVVPFEFTNLPLPPT